MTMGIVFRHSAIPMRYLVICYSAMANSSKKPDVAVTHISNPVVLKPRLIA
jgi:hypothetical protein